MNKRITQATQNDKQISKSIKRFFTRFHIYSALKAANAYKRKGTPNFAKDTVYRFMKMVQINCNAFYYNPCIQNHKQRYSFTGFGKIVPMFLLLMIPCLNVTVLKR